MNNRRILLASGLLALSASILGQSGSPRLIPIPKEPPRAVSMATHLGPKSQSDVIHISVSLKLNDPDGLQQFADSVSDPKSPNYRHFITPAEAGRRFGLPQNRVNRVADYLKSQGMNITLVAPSRVSILADTTVGQAEAAFHTQIHEYSIKPTAKDRGGVYYAFTSSPSVPSNIAFDITNIGGLENINRPKHHTYLTPAQLRALYSVATEYNAGDQGQGRTVGISNFDGFAISDEVAFVNWAKLPTPKGGAGTNITVETISGGSENNNPAGEGDLDIQATIGMAPLCNLIVYDGGNSDLIGVLTAEETDNTADIMTESYGWQLDSSTATSAHNLHVLMTAQGQTYMAASGDSGTNLSFPYPDTDPEVLSVGGTSATVNSNGSRNTEVGWNSNGGAGGGGWAVTSDSFNVHPAYQTGTGVPSASTHPYRLVPDVSFDADPNTGYVVFVQGNAYQIGGTSGASPCCAGSLADSEQNLIGLGALPADSHGHQRMGRLQDLIYYLNGDPNVFFDIISGTNGNLPDGSTSNAGPGWDFDSGWGPIIWSGFVSKYASLGTVTSLSLSPTTLVAGQTGTGTVTISSPAIGIGTSVVLTSSSPDVTLPSPFYVPAGQTTANFSIIAKTTINNVEQITITATILNSSVTKPLTLVPLQLISVNIVPTTIIGGNPATSATVGLNGNAPAGGAVINLASNDPSVTVPSSITVAAGSSTGTFSVATKGVNTNTSVNVSGTYGFGNSSVNTNITVIPASVSTVGVAPSTVVGGSSTTVTGTVTLNGQAGPSGDVITLKSSNTSAATVPATVTVASGTTSATFNVTSLNVTSTQTVTITATYSGTSVTTTLTVNPYTVNSVSLNPTTVIGGNSSTGTVTISSAAGPAGTPVSLSSNIADAQVPATVTVPSGATTQTFTVTTSKTNANETATITASIGSSQQTATLTLQGTSLSSVSVSPTTLVGGNSPTGSVTLAAAAPSGGAVINLSSGSSSVTVPGSVTVPAGATTAPFTVSTSGVDSSTPVTITASAASVTKTCTLTLLPASVYSLTITPNTVVGGSSTAVSATVSLNGRAGPSGVTVALSSSNTAAASIQSSVTIAAGTYHTSVPVSHFVVTSAQTVSLTEKTGTTSVSANLTVNPYTVNSVSLNPTTILGGGTSTGTVTISQAAGTAGVTVNLSSSIADAKVPATVAVASGATTAKFTVTSNTVSSNESAVITASIGSSQQTATLTLQSGGLSSVTIGTSSIVGGNTPANGTVTLISAAPAGGTVVNLSSGNSSVQVPSSVTVTAGSTTATFGATTSGVDSNVMVTITATLGASVKTCYINVIKASMWKLAVSPTSVVGGSNTPVTATASMNGQAGPSGAVLTLQSSQTSVATVPATVTVPAFAHAINFAVTPLLVSSTQQSTISATYGTGTGSAILAVNPMVVSSVKVNPTSVVGGNSTVGTVTLGNAAGASGVVVNLSVTGSDAHVPATVTVPSGATSANFTVTTGGVAATETQSINASVNSSTQSATLTLTAASIASITSASSIVGGNTPNSGTVTLTGQAPAGGVVVSLSSSDPSVTAPSSVTIPAGATSATYGVTTSGVNVSTPVTLTGTLGVSKTCTITVLPASLYAISLSQSSVQGGSATVVTLRVRLNGQAGSSPVNVALSSSNTAAATVPANCTIASKTSSNNVVVSHFTVASNQTVTITATLGSVTLTTTLTVTP